jgi:hypothetical protein
MAMKAEQVTAYLADVDVALRQLDATTQGLLNDRVSIGGKAFDGQFVGRVDEAVTSLEAVVDALLDAKARLLGLLPTK